MLAEDRILVTGATGNTVSMLLQELETRGARVRALVRERSGVERLEPLPPRSSSAISMTRGRSKRRFEGVTHTYLVTPSSPGAQDQPVRFAERAAAAGVRHLVKLSQLAADEASPECFLLYHAAVERRIRELGISFTFLRPNLYFQGLLAFQSMIAKDGRFVAPIGEARVSAADVPDGNPVAFFRGTERGNASTEARADDRRSPSLRRERRAAREA